MAIIIVDVLIVAVCLVGDLLTKSWAASALPAQGGYLVAIKDVLTFRYSENTGAAFGIFENSRVFLSVFVGVVLLVLLGYMIWTIVKGKYKEKGGVFFQVALSLILAGGIGNLVDRIALGYVRDFIEYTFVYTLFNYNFAICNLADVYLTVGVIMVMIYLIYSFVLEARKEKQAKALENSASPASEESLTPPSDEQDKKGDGEDE